MAAEERSRDVNVAAGPHTKLAAVYGKSHAFHMHILQRAGAAIMHEDVVAGGDMEVRQLLITVAIEFVQLVNQQVL